MSSINKNWKGAHMNNIIDFLGLSDDDVEILKIEIVDNIKYVHIQKKLKPQFCSKCNYRMHSKGIRRRKVRHPIFQDGFQLVFIVNERRWVCSNPDCDGYCIDGFTFFGKGKQTSNLTPFMVLDALKDLNRTAVSVADQFHISDTLVHTYVLTYLELKRLSLPRILSVDEVFLDFNNKNRYCLVLLDFETGDIVDLLPNRNKETIDDYFYSISRKERDKVETVICDMYGPYLNFPDRYFHNSKCIVDSFHVVSYLTRSINNYINKVLKHYQEIDNKRRQEKNHQFNKSYKTIKESREVILLKNYRFFLLKNRDDIEYSSNRYYQKRFGAYLSTYELEKYFMELDPHFERIRDLKEEYISFNHDCFGLEEINILKKLDTLIDQYRNSGLSIFIDFADHLKTFKKEIVLSFKDFGIPSLNEKSEEYHRRLSNGPMEGFNRKPKDLKRNSRGFDNFEYTRNRILWSTRKDALLLAIPKEEAEVHTYTKKKRGPYKKKH